jgi:hypothetical protein
MTTVDRPAHQSAQRPPKRTRTTKPRRPWAKPGDDRVVIIDIDGVLADLSAYESLLAIDERPAEQRWEEFFAHIPDAAVIDTGYDLAWAIAGLGYTIVYSTTRPHYTRDSSRLWLTTKDFPTGKAMFTRPKTPAGLHPQPAWQTKLSHARAVTHQHRAWLRAFIDDQAAMLAKLTGAQIPALDSTALTAMTTNALQAILDSAR